MRKSVVISLKNVKFHLFFPNFRINFSVVYFFIDTEVVFPPPLLHKTFV